MPGTKKRTKTKKKPKATSLDLELSGIRVRVEVGNAKLQESVAAMLATVVNRLQTEHDFDVVKRVIEIANVEVLEAIHTMAKGELERRANAS